MAPKAQSPYHRLQVARLKELAKQRGLLVGGSKEKLIDRLLSHNGQHPFPFLKLPSELRDMIYHLVLSDDTQFAEFGKQLSYASDRGCLKPQNLRHFRPGKRNGLMIQQPNHFETCRTIRAEGLLLFFRLRDFHFVVKRSIITLRNLLRWVVSLSNAERSNIRSMTVLFLGRFHMGWVLFLNELVELLPPKVTVIINIALNWEIKKLKLIRAVWDVLKPKARTPQFGLTLISAKEGLQLREIRSSKARGFYGLLEQLLLSKTKHRALLTLQTTQSMILRSMRWI